jgi:hypothetical protein
MRVVTLAAALILTGLQPADAQQRTPDRAEAPARTRAITAVKPVESTPDKEAAAARTRNEARERAWDDRVKRSMRSICSGAAGC